MPEQSPLYFVREDAKISTFRLPADLSYIATLPRGVLPKVVCALIRKHFADIAQFSQHDLEYNKGQLNAVKDRALELADYEDSEITAFKRRKIEAAIGIIDGRLGKDKEKK
ncbi:MAG: hypothetical protein PHI97_12405 [Desulfobulbus sp.]|nr:hypothetical protein [Desulfobulbus sp.]